MTYTVKDFQPGDIIGDFEILRRLKRGGQAVVYLARSRSGEDIAVSTLLTQLEKMEKKGQQARFIEEHRICVLKVANPGWEDNLRDEWNYLAQPEVKHDRLIKTFSEKFGGTLSTRRRGRKDYAEVDVTSEQGETVRLPYVSMAYEAGGSLDQVLKQQPSRTLSPSCAVSIAIQLGEVLHHLHSKAGLVHHDISPSNILLRDQLSPFRAVSPDMVLIDLAAADSPQNPRQRQIYGKKVYLPPERLLDPPAPISYHIDIYSVGILLYELLSGQRPQQNTEDIQNPHTQLPAIREVNSAVSPELNELVMQAIARNSEERKKHLPDMQHLVDHLKRVPEAQTPCRLRLPLTREAVMRLVPVIIALVLLIGLLGSGAFWLPTILTPAPTPTFTPTPTPTITITPTPTPTFTPTPTSIPPTSTPATSSAPEEKPLFLMDRAMIALYEYE